MKLDAIDTKLINLLQEDSKQTNKELSSKLDMSVTAVYERIKKLEKAGIIDKYVALRLLIPGIVLRIIFERASVFLRNRGGSCSVSEV